MKPLYGIILVILSLLAAGCATQNDVLIQGQHMVAEAEIYASKARAAEAIAATLSPDADGLERHMARESITDIMTSKSGIERAKTGNDVAIVVTKEGHKYATVAGLSYVGGEIASGLAAGGTQVRTGEGSTVNIERTEQHATSMGYDTEAVLKEPVKVEPTVVPVEGAAPSGGVEE